MFDLFAQALINFGTFLQQTTTGSPELDSIASIIMSIVALAGLVATFLKLFPRTRHIGQMVDAGYQKAVESEEMMRRGFAAVAETIPEIKEPLKKHGASLEYMDKRFKVGVEQLTQFRDIAIPGAKNQAKSVELTREEEKII